MKKNVMFAVKNLEMTSRKKTAKSSAVRTAKRNMRKRRKPIKKKYASSAEDL